MIADVDDSDLPWGARLRRWRAEVKSWSQQDLVDQVVRLAFETKEDRGTKLDIRLVGRWENGAVQWPQAVYRRLLAQLGAPGPKLGVSARTSPPGGSSKSSTTIRSRTTDDTDDTPRPDDREPVLRLRQLDVGQDADSTSRSVDEESVFRQESPRVESATARRSDPDICGFSGASRIRSNFVDIVDEVCCRRCRAEAPLPLSVVAVLGPSQTLMVLDELTQSVIARYELEGPSRLVPEVRMLRSLCQELGNRVSGADERMQLVRASARQSALLAYMSVNLSWYADAEHYALEASMLATAAKDWPLLAWIKGTQSFTAYYQERYDDAS